MMFAIFCRFLLSFSVLFKYIFAPTYLVVLIDFKDCFALGFHELF